MCVPVGSHSAEIALCSSEYMLHGIQAVQALSFNGSYEAKTKSSDLKCCY